MYLSWKVTRCSKKKKKKKPTNGASSYLLDPFAIVSVLLEIQYF